MKVKSENDGNDYVAFRDESLLKSTKNQLQADINNAEQIVETIGKIENSKISEEQDVALATLLQLARYSDVNRQQVLAVEAMGRELERTQKNLAAAKEDLADAKAKYETDTRIAAKKAEFEMHSQPIRLSNREKHSLLYFWWR